MSIQGWVWDNRTRWSFLSTVEQEAGEVRRLYSGLPWFIRFSTCWTLESPRKQRLGICMGLFLESLSREGKTHSECGWHHPMGWGPRLKKRERENYSIPLFLFLVNSGYPVASLFCRDAHHDRLYPHKLWAQINPSFLKMLLVNYCSPNQSLQTSYLDLTIGPAPYQQALHKSVSTKLWWACTQL